MRSRTRKAILCAVLAAFAVQLHAQNTQPSAESVKLVIQLSIATQNKQWPEAADLSKQLVKLNPDNWFFREELANAQLNLGQYEDAFASNEEGISLAQAELDSKAPGIDPAKNKTEISRMLVSEGNGYLKQKKNDLAIAAYTKAAEISPTPAQAYFNLCATYYNMGMTEGAALTACDKAIAADPQKADAYFVKGSMLFASSPISHGKVVALPGTAEALQKYLEVAPLGTHATDVKEMLEVVGAK